MQPILSACRITVEQPLSGVTTYLLPFNAHDSRFQNTRECLGITLGLLLLKRGFNLPRGTKIGIKSDSMSAIN